MVLTLTTRANVRFVYRETRLSLINSLGNCHGHFRSLPRGCGATSAIRTKSGSVCWWYSGPCNSRDPGYFYCEINQRHYCLLEATSTDSVCKPAAEAWNNIIHKKCLPYVTILRETMLAVASSLMVVLQVGKGLLGVGRL
ncbi:hypothetical protein V1478_007275 [Vespula squamosa]|uniref:Uncharacterized protein n=1 Tax=Vespula squamosa TaxID=30214 RepID=A0ABD2B2N7_VESSQ